MADREWQDVTEDFLSAIKELKLGELIKIGSFTLFEAMSAIEMMDPKMDTGMISNKIDRKILNLEQSIKCGAVKINNLDDNELIGIIDDTYACLVTWLEGHSLAQTVMTNLYLHEPDRVEDRYLRVFSYAVLKITDILKDIVITKYCFEEEDFQPSNYGFNLATNISDAKVFTQLKEVCEHLSAGGNIKSKSSDALLTRFKFTKHLYYSFMTIRKEFIIAHNNNNSFDQQSHNTSKLLQLAFKKSIPSVVNICDSIERNLTQCQSLIQPWTDTLDLGIVPLKVQKKEETSQNADYPTIMGFEPFINQKLMPLAYPKCPSICTREKSLDYLNNLALRLAHCCQSSRIISYNDIVKFMNCFSKYFNPSSCVISRSFLQLLYIPNIHRDLNTIQEVLRQDIRDLFNPSILQAKSGVLGTKPKLKEKIDSFFADCAVIFSQNLLTYGHNRARQREKLIDHLESLKVLQYKAILIDEMIGTGADSNYFSYWIGYYIINDSIQFVLSGLELELYSTYEYDYIFWYLYELLYEKQIEILSVSKRCIEEKDILQDVHDKQGVKNKNRIKSKLTKNKKTIVSPIHRECALVEALKTLSGGIFSLVSGLKMQRKIKTPKSDHTSEETVFVNRFKYLLGANVAKNFYDQFVFASLTVMESEDSNLYTNALKFFIKAKALLELLPEADEENSAYLKVAKTNLIVARLLSSSPGVSSKVGLEMYFKTHDKSLRLTKVYNHYLLTLSNPPGARV